MVAVIVKGSFTVQKYLVEIIIWLIYIIPVIISLIIVMLLLILKVFILFKNGYFSVRSVGVFFFVKKMIRKLGLVLLNIVIFLGCFFLFFFEKLVLIMDCLYYFFVKIS